MRPRCGASPAFLLAACLGIVACHSSGAPEAVTVRLQRLSFDLPAEWRRVPPNSSFRVAQAAITGAGGIAEMAVFHFGAGQGGDVEANLQRWIDQVVPDAGSEVQRQSFDSDGLRVTWVDIGGTLKPGRMGMGPAAAQPHARLLGAIIEGDGSPWFFKVTGDDATLAPQRDAFIAMLHSARPTS
jgi:hypothetical protein